MICQEENTHAYIVQVELRSVCLETACNTDMIQAKEPTTSKTNIHHSNLKIFMSIYIYSLVCLLLFLYLSVYKKTLRLNKKPHERLMAKQNKKKSSFNIVLIHSENILMQMENPRIVRKERHNYTRKGLASALHKFRLLNFSLEGRLIYS